MAYPHFYLKTSDSPEKHIVLRFIYEKGGKPFQFYTNFHCTKAEWDEDTERMFKSPKRADKASQVNRTLDALYNHADRIRREYREQGLRLNDEILKKELHSILDSGKPLQKVRVTFLQFFENLVKAKTSVPNYVKNSAKAYITTLNHIKGFMEKTGSRFDFEDIDKALLGEFVSYLRKKDFQSNHVQKLASTLKTVLRQADEEEIYPNFRLKDSWLTVPRVETDAIYLTSEEVKAIANFDLSANPRLDRVRDLFLIGCYTGLRFSDYRNLSENNFPVLEDGTREIELRAKKTGGIINYPLFPEAEMVLRKYNFNPPRGISDTNMNLYLKELGKLVGINQTFKFTKYIGGRRVDGICLKWEKISTHTCRRTFATNAMAGNMPVELIMHMTGHKNHKDFFKYIRFTDKDKSDKIRNHPYFKKAMDSQKPRQPSTDSGKTNPFAKIRNL